MAENKVICTGREAALRQASEVLSMAESGTDGRVVIHGARWLGKTLLLRRISELAATRGFTVIEFDKDRDGSLAIVLSTYSSPASLRIGVDTQQLQRHIEAQTLHGSVLVAGDDIHQADKRLLRGLRSLVYRLRGWPIAWVLAFQNSAGVDVSQHLNAEDRRTRRLELDPLPGEAVADLVAQLAGARPSPELIGLVENAGGNPGLISHLVAGLRSEQALEVEAGQARLRTKRLPEQVVLAVRARLDRLSSGCRQFVTAAAALGMVVALDRVAEVLGQTPGMLLPRLEEAVHEGVLAYRGDAVQFTAELLWQAIQAGIPRMVFEALRQSPVTVPRARVESFLPEPRTDQPLPSFNQVEWEIVRMVSQGMTNVQIARRMARSEHTVNYHLQKIYRRMNVHSRAELIGLIGVVNGD
jgi:DNA-binding CsgD family transcriptional regulator